MGRPCKRRSARAAAWALATAGTAWAALGAPGGPLAAESSAGSAPAAAAGSWTPLGPAAAGGLAFFAVSPQSARWIYAASADGTRLYATRDGGATWASLPVPPAAADPDVYALQIAVDPLDATTVYLQAEALGFGGKASFALNRSTDGGVSWTVLPPLSAAAWVAVDPQDDQLLYSGPPAARSADGGATWTRLAGLPLDVAQVVIDPASPSTVYALETAAPDLFKSIDRGVTWQPAGAAIGNFTALRVDPASSSTLYAAAGGYLEKSTDGGNIWQIAYSPADPAHHGVATVAVAPTVPTSVYGVVADTGVVRSVDGGLSWSPVPTATLPGAVLGLEIDPQNPLRLLANVAGAGLAAMTLPGPCVPGPETLCLASASRFLVTTTWSTAGAAGAGKGVALTPDTGAFWFFSPSNLELVVKVLDGCAVNGHYWVFAGGLTDVGVVVTATDTRTGQSRSYTNPAGVPFPPLQVTSAFATCP